MKSVTKYFKNLLSLMDKDVTRYVAAAVAAIIAFIMVGTYLVFKVRREEEKEKEREQRTATDSGSKKPVVRKRIGETDAYQGREFSLAFSAYDNVPECLRNFKDGFGCINFKNISLSNCL